MSTVLIAPDARLAVEAALVRTRTLASDEFNLDLRIGFVPVNDVRDRGAEVLVARYELSPGNFLAQFGGGGVELADEMIKASDTAELYAVRDYTLEGLPDLTGLSCRWEPLQTQKGMILCLLINPQADNFSREQAILSKFLTRLSKVLGAELNQASPVTKKSMRFTWPPKGLAAEAKVTRADKSYLYRISVLYLQSLIQWVLERFNLSAAGYNTPVYGEELRNNSDYCKFDDVLRMVLDCTAEQITQVRALLEEMHEAGDVDFGLYETKRALMTCLLFDLEASEHLHFIDGDDGGFHSASIGLKKPLAERE